MDPAQQDLTELLNRTASGDAAAAESLMPRLYGELHELAENLMKRHGARHTLQPTALVHEAWMRLTGGAYADREHFAAVAARAMRSVLVDHARRRGSQKRGGDRGRRPLDEAAVLFDESGPDLLALDEALGRLSAVDPELSRIVELRFFGGLTVEEVAKVQGSSTATVTRAWRVARMWLARELEGP